VPEDGGDDDVLDGAGQLAAGLLQREQVGAGDLRRKREPMAEWEHGIVGAVNDKRRCGQFPEPFPPAAVSAHGVMVGHAGRDAGGVGEDAPRQRPHRLLVERADRLADTRARSTR